MAFSLNFGRSGGISLNRAASTQRPPKGGIANHRDSSGPTGDILDHRPLIRRARNPAISRQVSGDFAESMSTGVNSAESRPSAADPAGRRAREPPTFPIIYCRYSTCIQSTADPRGAKFPRTPHISADFDDFRPIDGWGRSRPNPAHSPQNRPGERAKPMPSANGLTKPPQRTKLAPDAPKKS